MKNLVLVLSILFAIAVLNPQIYSQKKDHSKSKEFRTNLKDQLNLSEEQEKKIEALKLNNEEVMIKFKSDLELKELEIRKLKSSEKFSNRCSTCAATKNTIPGANECLSPAITNSP